MASSLSNLVDNLAEGKDRSLSTVVNMWVLKIFYYYSNV